MDRSDECIRLVGFCSLPPQPSLTSPHPTNTHRGELTSRILNGAQGETRDWGGGADLHDSFLLATGFDGFFTCFSQRLRLFPSYSRRDTEEHRNRRRN